MRTNSPGWYMNYMYDLADFTEGVARNLEENGPCALTANDWN